MHDFVIVLTQIGHGGARLVLQPQVEDHILDQAANQKFHRQVVNPFCISSIGFLGALKPGVHHGVAQGQRQRHAPVIGGGMFGVLAKRIAQAVEDIVFHSNSVLAGNRSICLG